jgi:sulfur transfer protein SufE
MRARKSRRNLVLTLREGHSTEGRKRQVCQDAKEWAVATQNWEPPQTKLLGCAETCKVYLRRECNNFVNL